MVIKRRYVNVDFGAEQAPVAEFIAIELFYRKVRVGIKSREIRCSIGGRRYVPQKAEVFLGIGGGTQCMRKRCPDGLAIARRPKQPDARLRFNPASEIGPKHF